MANLYYTHPILNLFAHDFHKTYEEASYIPTMAQAGYAGGLLLLCPLGDLVKRRPFTLWLVWFTATMWYAFSHFLHLRCQGLSNSLNLLQDRSLPHTLLLCFPGHLVHHRLHHRNPTNHAAFGGRHGST